MSYSKFSQIDLLAPAPASPAFDGANTSKGVSRKNSKIPENTSGLPARTSPSPIMPPRCSSKVLEGRPELGPNAREMQKIQMNSDLLRRQMALDKETCKMELLDNAGAGNCLILSILQTQDPYATKEALGARAEEIRKKLIEDHPEHFKDKDKNTGNISLNPNVYLDIDNDGILKSVLDAVYGDKHPRVNIIYPDSAGSIVQGERYSGDPNSQHCITLADLAHHYMAVVPKDFLPEKVLPAEMHPTFDEHADSSGPKPFSQESFTHPQSAGNFMKGLGDTNFLRTSTDGRHSMESIGKRGALLDELIKNPPSTGRASNPALHNNMATAGKSNATAPYPTGNRNPSEQAFPVRQNSSSPLDGISKQLLNLFRSARKLLTFFNI